MRKLAAILLIFCLTLPLVFAADVEDLLGPEEEKEIPTRYIYFGATPIKDALTAKSQAPETILKQATDTTMKKEEYPYTIEKTEIKIIKFRCDDKMGICGYWVEATRGGREVQTNSPIWISPPPYEVVISEVYDSKVNENVVTIKEDPKLAVERVLQGYVDRQPLGEATVGTKE